ncbi:TetR-like C-terminal domain-containing protein [Streptomyces albus]|uniref:TetR-like C-terminal domain-containing protein n=1 Tax=Streptomyces albus TaxID=1888 RepID=UPI0006E330E6|nr:TetR-like C-terminal domain-containing protein [Streptomyces albus]
MAQQRPAHGSVRPGGRTARTRQAVLDAALAELGAGEFGRLSVERLAARAGVHATTVRRRWGSVQGVVLDLFASVVEEVTVPDTGELREDLRLLLDGILALYATPRNRNLLTGMIAAVVEHPDASRVMGRFFTDRTRHVAVIVERAAARGEVPAGTDAGQVIEAVSAPVYYRLLVTHQPLDPAFARRTADVAARAARAGAFT